MLRYEADLVGNIEQALQGLLGYESMALELIQNADDAGAHKIRFKITSDALVVTNDALFTTCGLQDAKCPWLENENPTGLRTRCNFHAIARMGGRSKAYEEDQIGRFGIGFVSVFQITDRPIIRSGDTQLELDPIDGSVVDTKIAHSDHTEFELRWASTQTHTRDELKQTKTPPDVDRQVIDALERVTQHALLFLRHLQKIEVVHDGRLLWTTEIIREEKVVQIARSPGEEVRRWFVIEADGSEAGSQLNAQYPVLGRLDRSTVVQVAFPLEAQSEAGLLFAYLPTEQSSNLPCHINGDFFPVQTRKAVVLDGGQHSQRWNEMLLDTAAAAIAVNILEIRDHLHGERLWSMMEMAQRAQKNAPAAFHTFWEHLRTLKEAPIVLTSASEWVSASTCRLPGPTIERADELALEQIGMSLNAHQLRPYRNAISALGAHPLSLATLVDALESWASGNADASIHPNELLSCLWSVSDRLLADPAEMVPQQLARKRLKAIPFILGTDRAVRSIDELYIGPLSPTAAEIHTFLPEVPLADSRIAALPNLRSLFDQYDGAVFAADVADRIGTPDDAVDVIGEKAARIRAFYNTFASFADAFDQRDSIRNSLADTPLLKAVSDFIPASRGLLPGGFKDPIGHLSILDSSCLDASIERFLTGVLNVRVLTFGNYIADYLPEILQAGVTKEQYQALLEQIVDHRHELEDGGSLQLLRSFHLIRTRGDTFDRPDECYFWTAEVEALLGPLTEWYVDESWLPRGPSRAKAKDLLEKLGVNSTPVVQHLVTRLEALTDDPPSQNRGATNLVVRHLLTRFPTLRESDREHLEALRDMEWLPALSEGEPDIENWYSPSEVYQPFRAQGFASQVAVVDLPILINARYAGEFLNFLEMAAEPDTETIVAHVRYCIENSLEPKERTYELLNERLAEDAEVVAALSSEPCVYVKNVGFVHTDQVFWNRPPTGKYWHQASAQMRLREPLYRHLGVVDDPSARHYGDLLQIIYESTTSIQAHGDDLPVYDLALSELATLLVGGDEEAEMACRTLAASEALITQSGTFALPAAVAWLDSEIHVAPFGRELSGLLVRAVPAETSACRLLFQRLHVAPLSQVTQLSLSQRPNERPCKEATELLRERGELLLWIATSEDFRAALAASLADIRISLTSALQITAECHLSSPPSVSPPLAVEAFFQPEDRLLFVVASNFTTINWTKAFQAVFAQLATRPSEDDLRKDAFIFSMVMSAPSRADAEAQLLDAGFTAPAVHTLVIPEAKEIADLDVDLLEEEYIARDVEEADVELAETANAPTEESSSEAGDKGLPSAFAPALANADGSNNDAVFRSKTHSSPLGGESETTGNGQGGSAHREGRVSPAASSGKRTTQTSRLKSYVTAAKDAARTAPGRPPSDDIELIDQMAIDAALRYERKRGWEPTEQPHSNPGFDIRSSSTQGEERIIEVKGLRGEWSGRGVKLSPVQFSTAQKNSGSFWLYVVEFATSPDKQCVHAIENPFAKVDEYWFDDGWRAVTEEHVSAQDLSLVPGARIEVKGIGQGIVKEVNRRGAATWLKIDFGSAEGIRSFPYNSNMTILS